MRVLLIIFLVGTFLTGLKAQSPGGIAAGLKLWLKADSGPEKSAGVQALNGDAITTWKDKSSSGFDYVSVGTPTLQGGSLNFNPSVEILSSGGFDGPIGSELSNDWTLFFVSKKLASDNDGRIFDGSSGNFLWAHWGTYTNGIYINGNPSNYNSGIATTTGILNLHLHSYKRESVGGTIEARADGTSLATFSGTNSGNGIRVDIDQGAFSATEHSDNRIGEMIMYNSALTASDVNKVESYLGIKYGLTLSHDYLASDGSLLWTPTANSYHNDVAGIGRDDISALNQLKSLSLNVSSGMIMERLVSFASDKSYLLWGNDAATGFSTDIPATYSLRTKRTWKAAVIGSPGAVSMSVDLSLLSIPNTTVASDYTLLIDTDATFSSGATASPVVPTLVGNILKFTGVTFADGNIFTIAVSHISTPAGVPGAIFWVKGGVGVTGTSAVSKWADQSGFQNDANQSVVSKQPAVVTADLNFNDDINFLNPASIMTLTTPPANQYSTVFSVGVPKANSDWRTMFRGAVNDHPIIIENGGNRLGYYDNDGAQFNPSGFTWLQGEPALVTLEMLPGNVNFRKNGSQGSSSATISITNASLDYFGAYQGGSQNFGKIAETLIYNTGAALTATEKNKIESYLAIKYGLTLTHDYIASDGGTVWNSTTNAAYTNDVAGIGRDDNGTLNQLKSVSVTATSAPVTMQHVGAIPTDKSFLLWGNDGGTGTSTNIAAAYSFRTGRIWKTALQSFTDVVTVTLDFSGTGLPNTGNASDYTLLRNTTTNFTTATASPVVPTLVGNVLTFTGVTFLDGDFFAFAVANVSVPGGTTGLVFWVKGGVGVTGTANVSQWADQSGNGNNALQATAAKQPALVTSDFNFNNDINFYLPASIMTTTTPPANLNATIFAVAKPTINTDWRTMFRGAASDHPIIVETGTTRLGYYDNDNVGFKDSGFTWLQNEPALVTLEMRGTTATFRKNGTQGAAMTSINYSGLNLDYFGAYQGGSQNFGKIAEVAIYSTTSSLIASDKNKIESYLAIKYGITLTHDYLASDATVLWNVTTNSAYGNRITGIARDNASGLDQRKSLSVNSGAVVTVDKGGAFVADKNFLIWGDDNGAMSAASVTDYPAGTIARIARTWKIAQTGAVGAVSISFDLSSVGGSIAASDLRLLIDRNKNGVLADETVGGGGIISGAVALGGNVFQFSGVSFNDGELFSIGSASNSTPLPISLVSFKASAVEAIIDVTWTTITELNNDYFTLEKSRLGVEFVPIAKVKGAGNSNGTRNYIFSDLAPYSGYNYYRLKQTDYNGNSTLSKIILVDFDSSPQIAFDWKVYPNPSTGNFTIEGENLENSDVTITNLLGQRLVLESTIKSGKIAVETSNLSKGIYIITIRRDGTSVSKRIILN